MNCRPGCGACCIAPSITSPIPGMPEGKPSGVRCVQLTQDNKCKLFGKPERPKVCISLQPSEELCRGTAGEAMEYLLFLEEATKPVCLKQHGKYKRCMQGSIYCEKDLS